MTGGAGRYSAPTSCEKKPMFRRFFSSLPPRHSAYSARPRNTISTIYSKYQARQPISVVTAWDHITGKIAEKADMDIALVGDSLAMVALGYEDTNEIGLDEFLYHTKAVARGNTSSLLVADVPFGTFESSDAQAIATCVKLVKQGRVQAVKIEAGLESAERVKKIVGAGIPVVGHVGLAPQKHHTTGGYKVQGTTLEGAQRILDDCKALEAAGCFALLVECVPNKLAQLITARVSIPTIGIGAGPFVSGQVLVMADMLGMNDRQPAKFVKRYMDFELDAVLALNTYKSDLESGAFPDENVHGYKMKSAVLQALQK